MGNQLSIALTQSRRASIELTRIATATHAPSKSLRSPSAPSFRETLVSSGSALTDAHRVHASNDRGRGPKFQKKTIPSRRIYYRYGEILPARRIPDGPAVALPLTVIMKHLLFGALSVAALTACGGRVVVDGASNRDGAGGEGGAHGSDTTVTTTSGPIETTATGAGGATTGSGDPSGGCDTACGPNDGATCSCVKTCAPPSGFIKIACAPMDDGEIRCVCTLDGGNLSSVCFEINSAACDFENGCCAKYISGK
jgi:hypothetical protein